jgi:hypothetical protein
MSKQRKSNSALHSAFAGVEACDTQYRDGEPTLNRRRTLVFRIKPRGLWLIVGLSLAPGAWTLLASLSRLGLKWLLALLG